MNGGAIAALIAAPLIAFMVRGFNVILKWLARVLGVDPPEPIPEPETSGKAHSPAP